MESKRKDRRGTKLRNLVDQHIALGADGEVHLPVGAIVTVAIEPEEWSEILIASYGDHDRLLLNAGDFVEATPIQ